MGTIFYSIDDDNHSYPLETNWDIHEDGEYAAQDAAEDYHSNHDGWEASWPVYHPEDRGTGWCLFRCKGCGQPVGDSVLGAEYDG